MRAEGGREGGGSLQRFCAELESEKKVSLLPGGYSRAGWLQTDEWVQGGVGCTQVQLYESHSPRELTSIVDN